MAYPTTAQLNFKVIGPEVGMQPISTTSTTQNHPLGMRVRAQDFGSLGYGVAEFIYLKGVASTAAGDLVVYDPVAATTTRAATTSRGPLAVAMSANVASQYGWYAVLGSVPVNTTAAGTGAANALLALNGSGQATVSGGAGLTIDGAVCKTAQDTPSSGFTQVALHYPSANAHT